MLCLIPERAQRGLCIVRIMLGVIFIAHGCQKVFGLFGGPGLEGFAHWSATMNIPTYLAYGAAFCELIGGIMLLFGIATELADLALIPVMLGAVWLVHWNHGFFAQNGGFEYPLSLAFFLLALVIGGPGTWYLWRPCHTFGCTCKE